MKARRITIAIFTTTLLATAGAAPAAANNLSCVGWFASTFASEDGTGFAAQISGEAHQSRPFGWTTVAPFAHIALEECQGA